MNKQEFLAKLSKKKGSTITEADKWLKSVFETIGEAIQETDELRFIGFGTFKVTVSKARDVKTPKGEIVHVPAKRVVRFAVGSELKSKAESKK
ncbi:HU family DNA-binding protein [Rickettsiales endosymbiont of Trichoplax sp. H2]|uniref:HU family DNA-binding protein n=1 Tax=Rickettsiales endosymbiont of Trichoplax sp. H2 TaxID=2021221 RepID=UPI0012B252EA|nr:HU family DNA-binding protein [Rickettsiales endosymbiont of Trichoplax sp. H2]MSO14390.1 DNA-binding protein HU [Rickettsiales endosymbiont of Trichoplax sp. H2]